MLGRDSGALAQFRVDHRIPDDVGIERPGPNDDADWVEGEGNRMPIRIWFIYQAGLRFPFSKLLRTVLSICWLTFMQVSVNFVRTVMAVEALMQREGLEFTAEDLFHVYCVAKPRRNPETQMLEGNHYLCLRKPNQPQTRLVTDFPDKDQYLNDFIWVSGQWEFPVDEPDPFSVPRHRGYVPDSTDVFGGGAIGVRAAISAVNNCGCSRRVSDLLGYVPLYRYTIPLRVARQGRPVLPPLQIRGPGSRPRSSLSDKDINLGDESLNEEAEVEEGEEVDQIPTAAPLVPAPLVLGPEPINLPSSDSDVAIVEPREIVEHSYSHSDSSSAGSQLNAEIMAPKPPSRPTPAPAEDQSIAPSLMGGKRKGIQPAEGTSRPKRGKGAGLAVGTTELWAPQFAAVELGKQVTSVDTSKDHETCVALGNAVMLPQDVADHAAETTTEFGGKLVMLGAQSSLAPGDNRSGFCFEVAFAALCASASSLPPLSPGILGTCGGSPRVRRLPEQFSPSEVMGDALAGINSRFPTDGANCGGGFIMRKSEVDTSQIILPFNFSRSTPNLTSSSNTCTLTTAQHRSRVVQASPCSVSSSGFPPNSVYQSSYGVIVDVTIRINKSRHRGGQPLSSGQGSLASSSPRLLVADRGRIGQPCLWAQALGGVKWGTTFAAQVFGGKSWHGYGPNVSMIGWFKVYKLSEEDGTSIMVKTMIIMLDPAQMEAKPEKKAQAHREAHVQFILLSSRYKRKGKRKRGIERSCCYSRRSLRWRLPPPPLSRMGACMSSAMSSSSLLMWPINSEGYLREKKGEVQRRGDKFCKEYREKRSCKRGEQD
ncbi:hypothetical protein Acr_05g0014400 [Actinidia rufa]|uniref:Uncharacterized protein n=1 Tax=Actinidia rufa TaxID=165716 RepID=A0A7J0EMV1_9ERIC|nr:hypothetical protein Acr_05g0014400 [Actinidia rufa]